MSVYPHPRPDTANPDSWPTFFANAKQQGQSAALWLDWSRGEPSGSLLAAAILSTWPITIDVMRYLVQAHLVFDHQALLSNATPEAKQYAVTTALTHLTWAPKRYGVDVSGVICLVVEEGWLAGTDSRLARVLDQLLAEDKDLQNPSADIRKPIARRCQIGEALSLIAALPNLPKASVEKILDNCHPSKIKRDLFLPESARFDRPGLESLREVFNHVLTILASQAKVPEHILDALKGQQYCGWIARTLATHPHLADFASWRTYLTDCILHYNIPAPDVVVGIHGLLRILPTTEQVALMDHFKTEIEEDEPGFDISVSQEAIRQALLSYEVSVSPKLLAPWLNQKNKEERLNWIAFSASLAPSAELIQLSSQTPNSVILPPPGQKRT